MLDEVLKSINNYFESEKIFGTFHIENGKIKEPLSNLKDNQYFRIVGSVENDGIYQAPKTDLIDEVFDGAVWILKIPKDFLKLVAEIEKFSTAESSKPSPYVSESFGGYSYTKATSSKGVAVTWKDIFGSQLNKWRKI